MQVTSKQDSWCAVVNIFAASKKAASLWRRAEEKLKSDSIPFETFFTGDDGNAMNLAYSASEQGFRKFIAVGGDGTIHDVLEGIMFYIESCTFAGKPVSLSDFTLAVIPVGSGNDWIKTAGIPKDIVKAASLIKDGFVSRQDVVKVSLLDPQAFPEEKVLKLAFMANVAGVGLDANVCERVNKAKKRGKRGKKLYVSALLYNIIHRRPSFARIVCDGKQVFSGAFLSIAFGIGKYSGGGMRQTPDAELDDGLLDMTMIPDLPMRIIAKEAPKLFTGKFLTVKQLVTSRSRSITVIPYDESLPCKMTEGELTEVDGEVVGKAPVRFDVLEQQLNILTSRS